MSDNAQDIKRAIQEILVNPDTAKKVVDAVVPTEGRPKGWSRRSSATYYREIYAKQIKDVIDQMLVDRQDRIYRYDTWKHMSPQSVYLRINQSMRYLVDYMDSTDKRYARFLEMISVTRERNVGIKLTFIEEFRDADVSTFKPQSVIPRTEAPKWKQRIEEWLEHSQPGDVPFKLDNLLLTPDEVRDLKLQFVGLKDVLPSISATSIRLIRIAP